MATTIEAAAGLTVRLERMVTVTLAYPSENRIVHAVSCRYVPQTVELDGRQRRVMAIEVVHDPATPNPCAPYSCDPSRLERVLLPASALKTVRPYLSKEVDDDETA